MRRPRLHASASNAFAAAIGSASSLGLTIYIAHEAGTRVLGEYTLIAAVYAVLLVVDSARTQDLTTRYASGLGNEPRQLRAVIIVVATVIAGSGAALYGALTSAAVGASAGIAWSAAVGQIATAEGAGATQALQRFQRLALVTGSASAVSSLVGAALLRPVGICGLGIGLAANTVLLRAGLYLHVEVRQYLSRRRDVSDDRSSQTLSLTLLGGAAQLVNVTDALTIRSLASATQVGVYRAAAQLPTQISSLIYRGYDILMPTLAAGDEATAAARVRRTAPWLGLVNGIVLGAAIGFRHPVIDLILGHSDHDAETVLLIFSLVWLANSVIHPAALLLISRRRQQAIVGLVGVEYGANLILTIALVPSLGARGSAIATLATLAVSNLLLLPRILHRNLPALAVWRHLVIDSLLPTALAAALGYGIAAIVRP